MFILLNQSEFSERGVIVLDSLPTCAITPHRIFAISSTTPIPIPMAIRSPPTVVMPSDVPKISSANFPLVYAEKPRRIRNGGVPYATAFPTNVTFAIASYFPVQNVPFVYPCQENQLRGKSSTNSLKDTANNPDLSGCYPSNLHLDKLAKTCKDFLINTLKKGCDFLLRSVTAFPYMCRGFKGILLFQKKTVGDVFFNLRFVTNNLFFRNIPLPFTNRGKQECNGQRKLGNLCETNARRKYIIVQEKQGEKNYWRKKIRETGKKETTSITAWGDFCPPFKNLLLSFSQGYFSISYLFPKNLFSYFSKVPIFPNPISLSFSKLSLSFPPLNLVYVLKPLSLVNQKEAQINDRLFKPEIDQLSFRGWSA